MKRRPGEWQRPVLFYRGKLVGDPLRPSGALLENTFRVMRSDGASAALPQ